LRFNLRLMNGMSSNTKVILFFYSSFYFETTKEYVCKLRVTVGRLTSERKQKNGLHSKIDHDLFPMCGCYGGVYDLVQVGPK
jgi:hypothetical protein